MDEGFDTERFFDCATEFEVGDTLVSRHGDGWMVHRVEGRLIMKENARWYGTYDVELNDASRRFDDVRVALTLAERSYKKRTGATL